MLVICPQHLGFSCSTLAGSLSLPGAPCRFANIESRNRGGLVKLSDSVAFDGDSDAK